MSAKLKIGAGVVLLVILVAAGVFFKAGTKPNESSGPQGQMQPMPVTTETVQRQNIKLWKTFSARMVAVDSAEIRPQVSGTITDILFADGQEVMQDDVLFVIDPRPYEAALSQANADVALAENDVRFAVKQWERAKKLIESKAIADRLYDERANAAAVAKARLRSANARLQQARIDLDFAYIKAPIAGRVGRAEITKGNLVEAGPNAPVLTTVVSSVGIYADFDVDEQTYLSHIRSVARDRAAEKSIVVELMVEGVATPFLGAIHSFDNSIDPRSGTIRARAFFENKNSSLLPGMFAQIKLASPVEEKLILIDERAIGTNQAKKFVYLVNEENIVESRNVTVGDNVNEKRVVLSGLNEGDRVITDGLMRLRPSMPVNPGSEASAASSSQ